MNTITLNKVVYKLPTDNSTLSMVLNHYKLVVEGKKDFIKLQRLDNGATDILHTDFLKNVKREISIGKSNIIKEIVIKNATFVSKKFVQFRNFL